MSEDKHHELAGVEQSLCVRLQSDWANVLEDEESADAVLLVGDTERVAVHRLVLRARCAHLWDLLKARSERPRDGEKLQTLRFPHLKPKAVKTAVKFLYTAQIVGEDVAVDTCQLLPVCHEFGLRELSDYILQGLSSWLTPDSVCTVLAQASCCNDGSVPNSDLRADMDTVVEICMDFIHSHVPEVLGSENLVCLDSDAVISILTVDDVSASLEVVLKAVIRWGKNRAGVMTPFSNWTAEEKERVKEEMEKLLQHAELSGERGLSGLLKKSEEYVGGSGHDNCEFPYSKILEDQEDFHAKLHQWCGSPEEGWKLLYRASDNGYSAKGFHQLCDGKGQTVLIVKSTDGSIFGGFTDVPWSSNYRRGKFASSNSAFLYTLVNLAGLPPTRMDICQPAYAINNHPNNGPIFGAGADLYISNDCNAVENSYSQLDSSYSCASFPCLTLASTKYFTVAEYEVYGINTLN